MPTRLSRQDPNDQRVTCSCIVLESDPRAIICSGNVRTQLCPTTLDMVPALLETSNLFLKWYHDVYFWLPKIKRWELIADGFKRVYIVAFHSPLVHSVLYFHYVFSSFPSFTL
jgi:hypothetical protein